MILKVSFPTQCYDSKFCVAALCSRLRADRAGERSRWLPKGSVPAEYLCYQLKWKPRKRLISNSEAGVQSTLIIVCSVKLN